MFVVVIGSKVDEVALCDVADAVGSEELSGTSRCLGQSRQESLQRERVGIIMRSVE